MTLTVAAASVMIVADLLELIFFRHECLLKKSHQLCHDDRPRQIDEI